MGLRLITFNMRVDTPVDGKNSFSNRKKDIHAFLQQKKPDLLCCQELTSAMAEALMAGLPDYYCIGSGRDADFGGERCSICYRSDRFCLIRAETFWLSDTPAVPGSRFGLQSPLPRICTVLWLALSSGEGRGKLFRLYNTHLDHEYEYARVQGVKVILRHMADPANGPELPTILTGDLNATPGSEPIRLLKRAKNPPLADITRDLSCTFHDYGKKQMKIDYIFTDKATAGRVQSVMICHGDKEDSGLFLSDHFPVEAVLHV